MFVGVGAHDVRQRQAVPHLAFFHEVRLWEALDLLTVVLRCWTKVKPHQLDNAMALLEAHLGSMEFR